MRQLGKANIYSYYNDDQREASDADQNDVRRGAGHMVADYAELLAKLAEIHYLNPDYVIMLRGQGRDYRHGRGHSFLKPSIFRSGNGRYPGQDELKERFARLKAAETILARRLPQGAIADPLQRVARHRIIRWAILQHYEVTPTPLLDVTTSVRIAASFAGNGEHGEAYLFAIAVPNISSAITSNADAGIQAIRLSSICPPSASRPHFQEGYLLGQYPEIDTFDQKGNFGYEETDFGHRLISKFRFCPRAFWSEDLFPRINEQFLYPDEQQDRFLSLIDVVKLELEAQVAVGAHRRDW